MERNKIDYSQESVLIVEDKIDLRQVFKDFLSAIGFDVQTADNALNGLEKIDKSDFTFMLTDMKMPGMDGLTLIKKVAHDYPDISIIAMTGYSEGYQYIDVINSGANDFIKKPFEMGELEAKICRIINEREMRKKLNKLSITDSLTELYNQRHFYTRIKEELARAERQGYPLGLILFDLDGFKAYNDTYGHLAGDEVLQEVGSIVKQSIRDGVDSGYRYGGDEFAIILNYAELDRAKEIFNRIQDSLKKNKNVTASMGFSMFSNGMSIQDIVMAADKNLYQAKDSKKHGQS